MNPFIALIQQYIQKYPVTETAYTSLIPLAVTYHSAIQQQNMDVEKALQTFTFFLESALEQIKQPHIFGSVHHAKRTPFDYYQLGLDFVRPLLANDSFLLGEEHILSIEEKLKKKENVFLFSNHQTEADPQIISLLLEKNHPQLAENIFFVAGHKVTQDPVAAALSLGRSLFCIYSKRHLDTPPEQKQQKILHNKKTMQAMKELLSSGGICIYVAPSGGRDRKNTAGTIEVAPFDPQSIEMLLLVGKQQERPVHVHTLALHTYDLLPPPGQVEKDLGEQRIANIFPASLAFGEAIPIETLGNSIEDKEERRKFRAQYMWDKMYGNYLKLL